MEPFVIEIAGTAIAVSPMFLSTREYCKKYLTERNAEHQITVTPADLEFEQAQLEKEALEQSIRPRKFPQPFLERATILRKSAEILLHKRTLLLHGSTISVDGAAYLFTAPCGTGKSTHTRLWRQVFGDRAVMINDDKAFLIVRDDGVVACGSPWSGKHGIDTNISVLLKGICVISRGNENRIERIDPVLIRSLLIDQLLGYTEAPDLNTANTLVDRLMRIVPLWQLTCNMKPDAAIVAHAAMSGCDYAQR